MVQLLLDRGAGANSQRDDLSTPLHLAACYGGLDVTRALLEHKPNLNSRNDHGETPLHIVTWGNNFPRENCVGITRLLRDRGADVNSVDLSYRTPLHFASLLGMLEIVMMLLDHNANVNAKNEQGETPLHLVSQG